MYFRIEIFGKLYKLGDIERLEVTIDEPEKKVKFWVYLNTQNKPDCHAEPFATEADKQAAVNMLEAKKKLVESYKAADEASHHQLDLRERRDSLEITMFDARWAKKREEEQRYRQEREEVCQQLDQAVATYQALHQAVLLAEQEFQRMAVLHRRAREWWRKPGEDLDLAPERELDAERERSRSRSWGMER